jgi:hypothetical protein
MRSEYDNLRTLTDIYTQVQKARVAAGNRLNANKDGCDPTTQPEIHRYYYQQLSELEEMLTADMRRIVQDHPAWPWLKQV